MSYANPTPSGSSARGRALRGEPLALVRAAARATAASSARCARACASAAPRARRCATRGERVPIGDLVRAARRRATARAAARSSIFQDLTEIKQLQRQLLHTEKMASIGQLAAGVAHEINNPMGFVHANLFQLASTWTTSRACSTRWRAAQGGGRAGPERGAARGRAPRRVAEELDADYLLDDFAKAVRESHEGSERIRHIVQDLRAFSHPDGSERIDSPT